MSGTTEASGQTSEQVQNYYGKVLSSSEDLQTNACCAGDAMPSEIKSIVADLHDEVVSKYYGCGLVIPTNLEGLRILDLGCGAGRDCYILSKLVGEKGSVVGVDMTDEQLAVANAHLDYHQKKFNHSKSNLQFLKGNIENLKELGLEAGSFDLVISNCVINLVDDKEAVLEQVHSLLKPGGEMYFSDVYSDRRIPAELQKDEVLWGECLSGALYWNDFQNTAKVAGFADPRLFSDSVITVANPEIEKRCGNIQFYSATYRLFKIPALEPACEDYGQAVCYKGTIEGHPQEFMLDDHHVFEAGRMFLVCGNSYRMLNETRFKDHFEFFGNWDTHYGIFPDCGVGLPYTSASGTAPAALAGGCC